MTTAKNPPSPNNIGYLGPAGTFTEQALICQKDLKDQNLVPMARFVDVLQSTDEGSIDYGFVAIENAIEGTVNVTLDALAFDFDLLIQREVVLDIHHQLMAKPGTSLEQIKTVLSHPVANAQCRQFLDRELPHAEVTPTNSTSDAAQQAAQTKGVAAVGSALAGELNGLEVLATDIADHPGNQTRFVLVAKKGVPQWSGHDKSTVVLTEYDEDKPGSLVSILQEFAGRSINLSRLSSRPVKKGLGKYCFIVDFEGHIAEDVVADCLRSVRAKHADVKFLGSYATAGDHSERTREQATSAWTEATEWMNQIRSQIED